MDTTAKIACCKICLLAENMKTCKACQFSIGLSRVTKLPPAKMIITKTFAERWTTSPTHYSEHFQNYHGSIEVQR